MPNEAILSSDRDYTIFQFGKYIIRFRAPYSLEKYTEVKEWDNGYLVVMAKYAHNKEAEEEYIDLVPILQALYFDADDFFKPIEKVRISYDGGCCWKQVETRF
ncbi:hypothetical protein BRYFOR_09542 [Marvinbryantia formatexigens DSM 14469]|uniref:DUF7724 domain-containing protein n=1 Tax=Marvinbryantia formatexigens DSM 14469 TaxID=478749 RepID=C6LLJ4_9FIRM|nr:hypothetical protein [Marvinbryantia formatexigens]EET58534.1 hypothetical protein BRYFOR_09542 [Marvinbryantia formatexigens DSM 14469]UWO24899.1 hypothetical protein NQ534_21265 [Marvinbryantia formatexigens DSM 14469]SDH15814.1 hypothetical protein SAMN05660368_03945 [Marvinbryantia formatexigens]